MDLVFLNIAAILGLRWLSTAAQLGPASLVLWLLAVVIFFIPSGLTVMELSSRDAGEGGIYLWSKSAFGELHGFVAGWAYWVNNLFYFPSLLLFIAGTFLYMGGSSWLGLEDNAWYNAGVSLALLWLVIGANIIGLKRGKWIQNVGALSTGGVFVILTIAGIWAWTQYGSATDLSPGAFVPDFSSFSTITFFATMTFAFAGLELGSVMGGEIKDPKRSIPRSMVISGLVIAGIYILGTVFLMVGVPESEVDVITGIPQALLAMEHRVAWTGLAFIGALLVALSSVGGLGAWMTGVARIPYVIGIDQYLPAALGKTHPRWGTPYIALITQGFVVTLLMLVSVAKSTIEEAYVMLLDMTIILYFIPFMYMFASLPVLRMKAKGDNEGIALVPGGTAGAWIIGGVGFSATLLSVILALIPPEGTENPIMFVVKVGGGCLLFILVGLGFYLKNR